MGCGYSLEASQRDASNEYHNTGFHGEIIKTNLQFLGVNGSLSGAACSREKSRFGAKKVYM